MSFHKNLRGRDLHAPSQELVENNTGFTLAAMRVVALDGMGTAFPQVKAANPNQFITLGIVQDDILTGKYGYVVCLGFMFSVNTAAWTVGTLLFSDVSGNLTSMPIGPSVAIVTKQDASNGVLYVTALGGSGGGSDTTAWDVDGNDGITLGTDFLGTRDANPIPFRTNNVPVGQFDANGRFAIGSHNPASPLHIKSYPGYAGSGLQVDTFSLMSNQGGFVPAYTVNIPQNTVARVKFQVTARRADGSNRGSFTRSGLFYRQGGNTLLQNFWQSDFTSTSSTALNVGYTLNVSDVTFTVKNIDTADTFWAGHVEIEILGDST